MNAAFSAPDGTPFNHFFEGLVGFCENDPTLSQDILIAKEEFFQKTGKLKDNDPEFENRMNAFLLWFLFDRKPVDAPQSAVNRYAETLREAGQAESATEVLNQKRHLHSLFVHEKNKHGNYRVKDLFTKRVYEIPDAHELLAFPQNSIFETRIFQFKNRYCFANYFIQHPLEVNKSIYQQVKLIRTDIRPLKPFFIELHSYYVKWKNYRSIKIGSIYHFDKSLPEAK